MCLGCQSGPDLFENSRKSSFGSTYGGYVQKYFNYHKIKTSMIILGGSIQNYFK